MADELFNVVFRGEILPGHSLVDVKARFAQLFKMDAAKAEGFFGGKPLVLKANCDRATADKFKTVLEQAGALVEVRPAAAQQVAPQAAAPARPAVAPASAPTASPAGVSPAPASTATPAATPAATSAPQDPWSLSAAGANLLRPNENKAPAPVEIDTSHLKIVKPKLFSSDPEEPLEPPRPVVQSNVNVSAYQLAAVGEDLVPQQAFVPRDIDLSQLSLDTVGADVLREDERQTFVPANIDTSGVDIAPAGSDMGQVKPPPAPPAPSTDHIALQR
jgi:hypothetical protein